MTKPVPLTGKQSDFSGIVLKTAARGDLDSVRWLVARNPEWVQQVGPHGRTMLWEAAYAGHLPVVEYLIGCGAELDQPGCYYTPMLAEVAPRTAALLKAHPLVACALEEHGARRDFHDACYLGDTAFVQSSLGKDRSLVSKRKPRSSDPAAATPVFYAVAGVQPEVLRLLLDAGDAEQARNGLLLRWAAWRANLQVLEQLLACGTDPGQSGLNTWATDPDLRRLARQHGHSVDIDAPDWMGFPALVDACRGNHNQPDDPQRVRALVDAGASIHVTDAKGKTALHRAAQAGFTKIPQLLLQAGADIEAQDAQGETPLFDAVRGGRVETVRLLVGAGADTQARNGQGETPSDLAARLRSPQRGEIVAILGSPI